MFRSLFFLILTFPFLLNAQIAFISGNDTICDNGQDATVKIDFLGNPPFTFVYAIDGVDQPKISGIIVTSLSIPTKQAGVYTLESFNDVISAGITNGSAFVTVNLSPTALIHLKSDTLSVLNSVANFSSQSAGDIVAWSWSFGDNTVNVSVENPSHVFPLDDDGLGIPSLYQTALIITDNNGCSDTTVKQIWVQEEYWMYIPSAFTPNDDLINDKFCIEYHAIRENTFLFNVYNQQSDLMFQLTNPEELKCSDGGWDGTHYKTKKALPSDTYIYEIYFQDFEGWKHKEYGTIVLVR